MKTLNSNSLSYQRTDGDGTTTTISIANFTPGASDVTQLDAMGVVMVTEKSQDFIFDNSALANLDPAEPIAGDRIVWGSRTFEILSINEEYYRYTTSSRARIRVHTKQVA